MDDPVGRSIGSYQVVEQLGTGAMATVYKGYHSAGEQYVAIKLLHDHLACDSTFRARFLREAHTIASLEHRHILPVYEFGEDKGTHYLVMQYVTGGTLGDLIATGSLTIERTVQLICQIGEALAYAHRQGVIHRDIKPTNILIGQEGNAFLGDFGIAKVIAETNRLTLTGLAVGTPAYMAPEQVQCHDVDARTDIYALGILLYETATGELPFVAETHYSMAFMHIHAPPRPPRQLNPTIPEALERVILRAMAKNPADRFQTADDMVAALRAALAGDSLLVVGVAPFAAVSPAPTMLVPPAPAKRAPMPPVLQLIQIALAQCRRLRSFRRPWIVLLLLLILASGSVALALPDLVQSYVPGLTRPTPQSRVYIPKGTFTIKNQEIIVPAGRDVTEAYREVFVLLARQDVSFGPNAIIDPNAPPIFIGQPQKIRGETETRGTIYRATMEGLVFVPEH